MTDRVDTSAVFNSALETGLRSLCVLGAAIPLKYDLHQLLAFDHVIVHSGDFFQGPESLHPKVQQRNGELLVRRPLVTNGLLLMSSKGLVNREVAKSGIFYSASDLTNVFLSSLENQYVTRLIGRAQWAVEEHSKLGSELFHRIFNDAFDRWTSEFQFSPVRIGGA